MKPVMFMLEGSLVAGSYLLGHARWPVAQELERARVECRRPQGAASAAPTVLQLELNGVLTGVSVTVSGEATGPIGPDGMTVARLTLPLHVVIPANTEARWKCVGSPADPGACLGSWGLVMEMGPVGERLGILGAARTFEARYVNQGERLTLYDYDPLTMTFMERTPGLASGRADLVGGASFQARLKPEGGVMTTVLETDGNGLIATPVEGDTGVFTGLGVGSQDSPRLEFWLLARGEMIRVATVSLNGLRVVELVDEAVVASGMDRFVFNYGGSVKAALGPAGVGMRVTGLTN